jgi:acetyltransferase
VEFGFGGVVYPVGPSGGSIQTHRIYRSISDISDHIDLAVILTPARTVPALMEECGQKGVHRVIVETAGFREYGEDGLKLEEQIVQVAKRYRIRFLGPNCVG